MIPAELLADVRAFIEAHNSCGHGPSLAHATALLSRLAAAEAEAEAEAEGWRPIETAPDDGTRIMLSDGDIDAICAWQISSDDGEDDEPTWCVTWDGTKFAGPTHWRPLPPPPGAAT